jgi:hypothetical protein
MQPVEPSKLGAASTTFTEQLASGPVITTGQYNKDSISSLDPEEAAEKKETSFSGCVCSIVCCLLSPLVAICRWIGSLCGSAPKKDEPQPAQLKPAKVVDVPTPAPIVDEVKVEVPTPVSKPKNIVDELVEKTGPVIREWEQDNIGFIVKLIKVIQTDPKGLVISLRAYQEKKCHSECMDVFPGNSLTGYGFLKMMSSLVDTFAKSDTESLDEKQLTQLMEVNLRASLVFGKSFGLSENDINQLFLPVQTPVSSSKNTVERILENPAAAFKEFKKDACKPFVVTLIKEMKADPEKLLESLRVYNKARLENWEKYCSFRSEWEGNRSKFNGMMCDLGEYYSEPFFDDDLGNDHLTHSMGQKLRAILRQHFTMNDQQIEEWFQAAI